MVVRLSFVAVVVLAGIPLLVRADALGDSAPSPSPLPSPSRAAPAPYVSAEEEVSPTYDDTKGSSTVLNLRAQIPFVGAGLQQVFRIRLPIVTSAPQTAITGAGDIGLFDLAVLSTPRGRWLGGATIRIPSAQNDSLGSGKYSIGPALGYETHQGAWTLGFFNQNFFSVIGPSSRSAVGQTKIEPTAAYTLPRGWSIGTSTMSFTYDWVRNAWTEVPIGLRIDKAFRNALRPIDAYAEFEKNLAAVAGVPGWTFRAAVKWTFSQAEPANSGSP
jgi:hypothetical protein